MAEKKAKIDSERRVKKNDEKADHASTSAFKKYKKLAAKARTLEADSSPKARKAAYMAKQAKKRASEMDTKKFKIFAKGREVTNKKVSSTGADARKKVNKEEKQEGIKVAHKQTTNKVATVPKDEVEAAVSTQTKSETRHDPIIAEKALRDADAQYEADNAALNAKEEEKEEERAHPHPSKAKKKAIGALLVRTEEAAKKESLLESTLKASAALTGSGPVPDEVETKDSSLAPGGGDVEDVPSAWEDMSDLEVPTDLVQAYEDYNVDY